MAAHKSSVLVYVVIFVALLVLTGLTVAAAEVNLGPMNDVVALAIAVTKATLVVLFFMHVKDSTRLTKLTVVASFFWLAILITLTLADYMSRPAINAYRGVPPSRLLGQLGESEGEPTSAPGEQESRPLSNDANRQ
jgi:cytochrome c oxidase subunit 4